MGNNTKATQPMCAMLPAPCPAFCLRINPRCIHMHTFSSIVRTEALLDHAAQVACHRSFPLCPGTMASCTSAGAQASIKRKSKFYFLAASEHFTCGTHCTEGISSVHMVGTGVFRTPFRSPLFSSTGSLNHVFLNPVSLEHVCFINCSLSLLPSACFPQPCCMHFPITSPSTPHNQRISSLY